MRLANIDGLFSIIKKDKNIDRPYYIGTQVHTAIKKFMKIINKQYVVYMHNDSDYRYRIFVSKDDLKKYMNSVVDRIDYSDFKGKIKKVDATKDFNDIWNNGFSSLH